MIPEGVFKMGGTGEDDSPMFDVAVARFELDALEVTMGAYAKCVATSACAPPKADNPFCNVKLEGRDDHPVNCVDYRDAEAYCTFVSKRLPTEREWEYAARGGKEQRTFSWGEEPPDGTRACYMHTGGSCKVGSYAPGAFGLFDMSGNVWEWTASWFAPYPQEPANGLFRVYRGGSWSRRFPKWLHNELRNRYRPDEHSASLGFRCAKSVSPTVCATGARVEGTACVPDGTVTASATPPPAPGALTPPGGSLPGASPSSPFPVTPPASAFADQTPVRSRAPEFDEDCKHYPGSPNGYMWRGGTFQAREPLIHASGCKKRDIGVGWTSACCSD